MKKKKEEATPKTYGLGKLTITTHESETLPEAFGLTEEDFDTIINTAKEAWSFQDTISESVEFLVQKLQNSELILGLLVLGCIWEESSGPE